MQGKKNRTHCVDGLKSRSCSNNHIGLHRHGSFETGAWVGADASTDVVTARCTAWAVTTAKDTALQSAKHVTGLVLNCACRLGVVHASRGICGAIAAGIARGRAHNTKCRSALVRDLCSLLI